MKAIHEAPRGQRGALAELEASTFLLKLGYQVFRNVSPHGPIDIIGLKDGVFSYFDVKSGNAIGASGISEEQRNLGVQLIFYDGKGVCSICPLPEPWADLQCVCGRMFKQRRKNQLKCHRNCKRKAA